MNRIQYYIENDLFDKRDRKLKFYMRYKNDL